MVDTKLIKSKMVLKDMTMEMLAKSIGISSKTLYTRFKSKKFHSDEIVLIAKVLDIQSPAEIFFNDNVTY